MGGNVLNIGNMLHSVSAAAKDPVMWLLIILLIITAFLTGSAVSEALLRLKRKMTVPELIRLIDAADKEELEDIIKASGMNRMQQKVLLGIARTEGMSSEMRTEAAQGFITQIENYYSGILNWTDLIIKIAPMAGLMGTLIPLGPGIMALGHGDMETLSESIITAFDTTVAGLISAGFATVISSVRKLWYKKYIADIESVMECLLEKMDNKTDVKSGRGIEKF